MINLLCREGWHLAERDNNRDDKYATSSVQQVLLFLRQDQRIDVVVSTTDTAITLVFEFHSMVVMNFITADAICSAYLMLLLQEKSIVNPYALYQWPLSQSILGSWEKYEERGIEFTRCPCTAGSQKLCHCQPCSLVDGVCMWVNVLAVPHAHHDSAAIFKQLGVFDVEWWLGGRVCGCLDALMGHYCRVVVDES